mgnify:CR=1 FL=1
MSVETEPSQVQLAGVFRLVGWVGFWLQIVLGTAPILVALWFLLASPDVDLFRGRLDLLGGVALVSWALLLFTTLWFLRYVLAGRRMREHALPRQRLIRVVATGLVASSVGIVLSAIVLLTEVTRILGAFLKAPQGGIPVIQPGLEGASIITAVDAVSLLGVSLVISAEILVLVLGLYLVYRVSIARAAAPAPAPPVASPATAV